MDGTRDRGNREGITLNRKYPIANLLMQPPSPCEYGHQHHWNCNPVPPMPLYPTRGPCTLRPTHAQLPALHLDLRDTPFLRPAYAPEDEFGPSSTRTCSQQYLHMLSAVPAHALRSTCTCSQQYPHTLSAVPAHALSSTCTCSQQYLHMLSATRTYAPCSTCA